MEYPTFNSFLAAIKENDAILRVVDYSVKERERSMKESLRMMREIIRRLEEIAMCRTGESDSPDRKAA